MRSRLRARTTCTLFAFVLLCGPAAATTTDPGRPAPAPDVIDCALDSNKKTCVECGSGGILACCYEDDCDVKNKPKTIYVPPRSPYGPSLPGWGMSWEIL